MIFKVKDLNKINKTTFELLNTIFKEENRPLKLLLGEKATIESEIQEETVELKIEFDVLMNNKDKISVIEAINKVMPIKAICFEDIIVKFPFFSNLREENELKKT